MGQKDGSRSTRRSVLRFGAMGVVAGIGYAGSAAGAPGNEIVIERASSGGGAGYDFTVSGSVEATSGDSANGSSASGTVWGGADAYEFSGRITEFNYAAPVTVTVNGEQVDPDSLGGSGSSGSRSLAIVGTGSRADYGFTVSGDLGPGDARGGAVNGGDTIKDSSARGAVGGGTDSYSFSGEITSFSVDGDVRVFVDGEEVDPGSFGDNDSDSGTEHALVIEGSGDRATYTIEVSGTLAEGDGPGSLGSTDEISGSSAAGVVFSGSDPYAFTGTLRSVSVDGPATVLLDGDPYSPESGSGGNDSDGDSTEDGTDDTDHVLTVDGTGSRTTYSFTVSGSLSEADGPGSLGSTDEISGSSGRGAVFGGPDSYAFSGEITSFSLDGDARVLVDGEEVGTDSGGSWTQKARLPRAQSASGGGVIDGRLYYFGGFTSGTGLDATQQAFVYDPAEGSDGSWDRIADMPERLWAPCGVSTGSEIYSFGGSPPDGPYSGDMPTDTIYKFSPDEGWTNLTQETGVRCPYPNWAMSGIYDPDRDLIYCFGGGTDITDRDTATTHGANGNSRGRFDETRIWTFDPASERVDDSDFARLPEGKRWSTLGRVEVDGDTYIHSICGGLGTTGPTDSNVRLDPDSGRVREMQSAPRAGMFATTANPVLGNEIYLTHGRFGRNYTTKSYRYDPEADDFSDDVARPRHVRNRAVDATIDGTIYVIGGHIKEYSTGNHAATRYNEAYTPFSLG